MIMSELHTWARRYVQLGWAVFPLIPGTKTPLKGSRGSTDATTDLAQIDRWWAAHPEANIGTRPSFAGLYVFDVDPKHGGDEEFVRLQGLHGEISSPLMVNTPSGGWHLYYAAPAGDRYQGRPGQGIDGKYNGYAILPPSKRSDGLGYTWADQLPGTVSAPAIPAWLVVPPSIPRDRAQVPGTLHDVDKIRAALDKLDPDDYHDWTQAMASVKHWEDTGGEELAGVGFELVREWSSRSAKHDDGALEDKWQTWDSNRPGARTLGSLLHDAGMTAAQQTVNAQAAFASASAEQRAAMWTTTPVVPFTTGKPVLEIVTNRMRDPDSAFSKAWNAGDHEAVMRKLAWQLGGNCEKVLEGVLMMAGAVDSPELREKITVTCAAQNHFAGAERGFTIEDADVQILPGNATFGAEEQVEIFKGCTYVMSEDRIMLPSGIMYGQSPFNVSMPQGIYALTDQNKVTDKPWDAFTRSQFLQHRRAERWAFRPDIEPNAIYSEEGTRYVNSWRALEIPRMAGDATPFLAHLELLLDDPRDREILLSYMAAMLQYPGHKFRWAVVLQGAEGNGKGRMLDLLQGAIGLRYTHIAQAHDIGNKFNDWIVGKLLIGVNEINTAGDVGIIDTMKPMISDDVMGVQGKNVAQSTERVFANFFFTTNRPGAMGKAVEGRRYAIFHTQQQTEDDVRRDMPGNYFTRLTEWIAKGGQAVVNDYLLSYQIRDEFNPATECIRAPRTSSYGAAVEAALGSVEGAILECIEGGQIGFRGGFVSSFYLAEVLNKMRKDSQVPVRARRALMQSLGYDWHPALRVGRATCELMPENYRSILYAKTDHPVFQLTDGAAVGRKYSTANSPMGKALNM